MPALVAALNDPDPAARQQEGSDVSVPRLALSCLYELGRDAKPAVPALLELIEDNKLSLRLQADAWSVLRNLGPDAQTATPRLIAFLNDPAQYRWAQETVGALAAIGPTTQVVPAFLEVLRDPQRSKLFGREVREALAQLGEAALPFLVDILGQHQAKENLGIREDVATILGWMGSKGKDAEPALRQCLDDLQRAEKRDFGFQLAVAEALWKATGPSERVVAALIECLKNGSGYQRRHAAQILGEMGPKAQAAVADLLQAAKADPDPEVRKRAAEALKQIR